MAQVFAQCFICSNCDELPVLHPPSSNTLQMGQIAIIVTGTEH